MILEILGLLLLGAAAGYVVCKIVVPFLSSDNIKDVSGNAVRNSDDDKAKAAVGKVLTGIVKEMEENGGIKTVTIDMLDDEEKIAEISIESESVSQDVYVGRQYTGICI